MKPAIVDVVRRHASLSDSISWAELGIKVPEARDLVQHIDRLAKASQSLPDHVLDLIRDLTDEDDCYFDHHRGCQAHGYLNLQGRKCPHQEAKELLAAHRPTSEL